MKSKDASLNPNIVPFAKLGSNIQDMWTKSLNNNVIDAASRIKFKKSNIIQNVNLSKDMKYDSNYFDGQYKNQYGKTSDHAESAD